MVHLERIHNMVSELYQIVKKKNNSTFSDAIQVLPNQKLW